VATLCVGERGAKGRQVFELGRRARVEKTSIGRKLRKGLGGGGRTKGDRQSENARDLK